MTDVASRSRPSLTSRRVGYTAAAVVLIAMVFIVNVWPAWDAASFLTEETEDVLGIVNASLIVSALANVVYLVRDPVWLTSLGGLVTSVIGVVAAARVLQVFPFDFGGTSFDWELVLRVLLIIAIVGGSIGAIAQLVSLMRAIMARQ